MNSNHLMMFVSPSSFVRVCACCGIAQRGPDCSIDVESKDANGGANRGQIIATLTNRTTCDCEAQRAIPDQVTNGKDCELLQGVVVGHN